MGEFKFKRFSVKNDISAMKVNTDGVLLGAWMRLGPNDHNMLDVGTGTGVIALIAAQRMTDIRRIADANSIVVMAKIDSATSNGATSDSAASAGATFNAATSAGAASAGATSIDAIDIDADSIVEAKYNFEASERSMSLRAEQITLRAEQISFKELSDTNTAKYDLIFSNPPYFIDSLKAPQQRRSTARHNDTLPHKELIDGALKLLLPEGRLALILPYDEGLEFISSARLKGLYVNRICRVITLLGSEPKRIMVELSMKSLPLEEEELTIQKKSDYTEEYKSLTKDFYLKF